MAAWERVRSVEREARNVPFGGGRPGGVFDAVGGFPRVGVEQHGNPGDGPLVVFAFAAHVTYPGGEVCYGDQFLSEPSEISDVPHMHYTRGALTTRRGVWGRQCFLNIHLMDSTVPARLRLVSHD